MGQNSSAPPSSPIPNKQNVLKILPTSLPETAIFHDTAAVWSAIPLQGSFPSSRFGHITVSVEDEEIAIIGYGKNKSEQFFSDFWILDLKTLTWKQMDVDQSQISPRAFSRAVYYRNSIWIFGGQTEKSFCSDLHVISRDGTVTRPETTGAKPEPTSNHVMELLDNKILIYGGSGLELRLSLYILNLENLEWTKYSLNHGRANASFAVYDSALFVYGGSKTPGLLKFTADGREKIIKTTGDSPPSEVHDAVFVPFGNRYLILIGGQVPMEQKKYAPIWILDMQYLKWSVLEVRPDEVTTAIEDGEFDAFHVFQIPSCMQASAIYRKKERQVVAFLGECRAVAPRIFVLKLGVWLSLLNHQADMYNMLDFLSQ